MKLPIHLLLVLFLTFSFACGSEAPSDQDAAAEQSSQPLTSGQKDSIRQLYFELMAAREDTMPSQQIHESGKLYPVDEAAKDTSFFIFREQLKRAVQRRDLFKLMDVIHPQIKVNFAGGSGVADFVSAWNLDSPDKARESKVWDVLAEVLRKGGTFKKGGKLFIAPYTFSAWPGEFDPFEYGAITGSGVRLRSAPDLNSRTLTMVSYDVVKKLETTPVEETIGGETHPWVKIQLTDGTEGFIYGKYISSSIAYRVAFERQADGKWLMIFLVAGD